MQTILVCDDERDIVSALQIYLNAEGYRVLEACNGREALAILSHEEVHLVLLDIMMPAMDGLSVLTILRESYNLPVILLTAKSEDTDKVIGLNVGADDYVTKPFNPVELLARVRSQLRRYTLLGARTGGEEAGVYTVGNISLNEETKRVTVDGESVTLTPLEYNILHLLIRSPGRIYSSAQIYEAVWNEDSLGAETSVAVHIRHLRQKIEINPSEPRYLKVVWGLGYKMEDGEK